MRLIRVTQFGVVALWIICVSSWTSEKCVMTDGFTDVWRGDDCHNGNLTVSCMDVDNVPLHLAIFPISIQTLCVQMRNKSILHPNDFSRFDKLVALGISGQPAEILPGAFRGLFGLQTLSLTCSLNLSIHSNTFKDLHNLKQLRIISCSFSVIALDAFDGMKQLTTLTIMQSQKKLLSDIKSLSEVLCRIVNKTSSLTSLVLWAEIATLSSPKCIVSNGTTYETPSFYGLQDIVLNFPDLKTVGKGVFEGFKNISFLNMPLNNVLQMQLLQSGVSKVETFQFWQEDSDLESMCEIVYQLSTSDVSITTDHINFSISAIQNCMTLRKLSLQRISISPRFIDLSFIHGLRNLQLLTVDQFSLNNTRFTSLCKTPPSPILWLKIITLCFSSIFSIHRRQFFCMKNLEELNLKYNRISTIDNFAFLGLQKLKVLNLGHNQLSEIKSFNFFDLHCLEYLNLEANPLVHIEALSFAHLSSIQNVFLGDLNFPPESKIELNLTFVFGSIPRGLTYLYISSGRRPMTLIIGGDGAPNPGLGLHVHGETVSFQDCERPFFRAVVELTARTEWILCGSIFAGSYFKFLQRFKLESKLSALFVDLTSLNTLVHLRDLQLTGVDLNRQTGLAIMFHNLTRLETLMLLGCRIDYLEKDLSKDLQSLRELRLVINNELTIMEEFPEPLKSLKYLLIQDLLLQCSCNNAWFDNWAKRNRQVQVMFWHSTLGMKEINCIGEHGTQNFLKYSQIHCSMDVGFILFVSNTLGLLLFMLVVLLHHLAGQYLLALFYITRGWLEEAVFRNNKRRYGYDAFVSYSGKDERWVVEELLPNMEQRGPPFLRLCLHSRDFQLGKDIVDNITDCLYSSRRTVCLVSRHYLRSNWCSLEMKLATDRLRVEQRDILILVFLEDISPHQLSAHHRLARLVKTRTYLDWPKEPEQYQDFWDRLWATLAPKHGQ
ncbi:toll-like receptor 13 [Salvelinus sp. IW2-2015]|uniref:toll-like receptor 13 n=1 Tax=Salvelinus sp. IW2-2015 TaxID=2691554 RepID=UPI000CDFB31E|nr:toll-like receptor 13 [Salvelinus alpinus]